MGLLPYLQRYFASLLRPWLLLKDLPAPLTLRLRFSQLVLELPFLELDCSAINSSLFASSTFLLDHARLDRATLTISFFRSPGFFLELRGLHLAGNPRPGEDSFWAARRKRSADEQKREAVSALDPQGAAVHAAAERLAKGEASSSVYRLFWLSLVLRAIRIELLDVAIELHSNTVNHRSHRCSLHSQFLTLEEGFPEGAGRTAGLFGALIVGLVDALRRVDGPRNKIWVAQNFYVHLAPAPGKFLPTSSEYFSQPLHDSSNLRAGTDSVNERVTDRDVWNKKSGCALLWKTVLLITTFCETQFYGINTDVAETTLQLNPADVEALLSIISQLQGVQGNAIADNAPYQDSGKEPSKRTSRRGKYLWDKAVGRLLGGSWRRKLKYAVEASVLRHRYAQLYASWLRGTGWGVFSELSEFSGRQTIQGKKSGLKRLESELIHLEQELPVEAITLGRCVARCKVSTSKEGSSIIATRTRVGGWDDALSVLKPVFGGLERVRECILLIFCCFYTFLCKGTKQIVNRLFEGDVHQDDSQHTVAKDSGSCYKCRQTESGEEWTSSFITTFQRGSFVFAGLPDAPGSKDLMQSKKADKSAILSAGMAITPTAHFTWGNLFLTYQSNDNKLSLEFICGYVQGEMVSAISTNITEESGDFYGRDQGSKLNGENVVKFLESVPAPHLAISERAKEFVKDGDFHGTSLLEKNQFVGSGVEVPDVDDAGSKKTNDGKARPFLLFELESSQADTRALEMSSGVVKCGLAVGRLDCDFDGTTFTNIAFLIMQFLEVLSVDKPCSKGDAYNHTIDSSTGSSKQLKGEEWEASYAAWMKQYISAVVFKKRLWLTAAIESPKLQFSLDLQRTGKGKGSKRLPSGVHGGKKFMLVLFLGLFEATVWPAQAEKNSIPAVRDDKESSSRRAWYDVKEMKKWLRKPPNPHLYGDSMFETYSEHRQVGNNVILSMHGAALTLQVPQDDLGTFTLVGPLKMTWECSLCRDSFVSVFHLTEIVSFAAVGLLSAISASLYLDELEMLFEAGKVLLKASEQVSLSNNRHSCSLKSVPKTMSTQSDEDQWNIQGGGRSIASESKSVGTFLTSEMPPLYFAASAEVKIENIDCHFGSKRNVTNLRARQEQSVEENIDKDAVRPSKEVQGLRTVDTVNLWGSRLSHHVDMIQKTVWAPCKDLCFQLSWGDGRQLCMSARCREAKVCVIENGSQFDDNECTNFFKAYRIQKVKDTSVESANSEMVGAQVLCELQIQQLSFCLKGPLLSSEAYGTNMGRCLIVERTHLSNSPIAKIESVEGQNQVRPTLSKVESVADAEAHWLTADLEISKIQLTDCTLDRVISIASLRLMGSNSFCIHVLFTKEFECISIISKGGMFVLHAQALSVLIQQLQYLLVSMKAIFIEIPRSDGILTSVADSSTSASKLGKSSSLPIQNADTRALKQRRLCSAPIRSCMGEEATDVPGLTGVWSVEVGGLCVLLAQTNSSSGDKAEGLLFEVNAVSRFEGNVQGHIASLEITRFAMCSLQSVRSQYRRSEQHYQSVRIPKFGSSSTSSARLSGSNVPRPFGDVSSSLREVSPFCDSEVSQLSMERRNHELVSSSDSGGVGTGRVNDYILENLRISCRLENNFNKVDFQPLPGSDGWKGTCSFMGIDIAITTLEIQLLLALFSCFSSMAASYHHPKSLTSSSTPQTRGLQQMYDHGGEIPDGSIVAVKDVREHLYIAVEKTDGHHRLVGVLHYSLVGDRALFKVKYQKPGRNSSLSSFSLISVSAKNAHGEHFRVHFRPGSGLADIASTHDGSSEQWQTISYTYSTKEDDGDIDIYGDLYNNLVYLVNQKSKQGLSLASGAPMMVKKPGSPFKFKILGFASAMEATVPQRDLQIWRKDAELSEEISSSIAIPKIDLKVERIILTFLHETGGKHLLPLLRGHLEDAQAVVHVQSSKIRLMGGCKIILEYLEPHGNQWSMIMQPVDTEIFYRLRRAANEPIERQQTNMLTSLFARFKKVDIVIGETSLDVILFMIGALDLAGPYTMRHSPVLTNSCLVENHTGLDLCCSFDNGTIKEVVKIAAWKTDSFLVRNMASRRDLAPSKVSSSVALYLEKTGFGSSSPIYVSLAEPGITAVRTRLENEEGRKKVSGPIVVVDVLKQSPDGITVSASPMVRIHNASGLPLELQCRRPNHDGEGAVVTLEDGDVIDDSMGAFDSMKLQGELRKALSSFNLGNFLLSIRPARVSLPDSLITSHVEKLEQSLFDWSDDIKGEKARHASGFLEKLQYGLRKSMRWRSLSYSFGTVHCGVTKKECDGGNISEDADGVHLCVRSTRRQVPVTSVNPQDKPQASRSIVAWHEQQELVILPTIRVYNLLQLNISITLAAFPGDKGHRTHDNEVHIEKGGKAFMYAELAKLFFTVKTEDYSLTSKPVSIGDWKKNSQQGITAAPDDGLKELEMELDFGDNVHFGKLKVFRGDDGVLQILVHTQYAFENNSDTALLCCAQKHRISRWGGRMPWRNEGNKTQWPPGEPGICIDPGSKISWLDRSCNLLLQLAVQKSEATGLDLESFSGSMELSIAVHDENSVTEQVHLGVTMDLPSAGDLDPTIIIHFVSRFRVLNDSKEAVFVCQDGLQEDENAMILLNAGEDVAPRTLWFPGQKKIQFGQAHNVGSGIAEDSLFSLRFRIKENGWDWSGPVCASALGSFSLRICRSPEANKDDRSYAARGNQANFKFVSINVEEHTSSLIMRFCIQLDDTVPYRIENALPRASIMYHQKGLSYSETLEQGQAVGYAWDNLSLSHKLVVQIAGTKFCKEINLDKLAPWKSFRTTPHNTGFGLQLPFHNQIESNQQYDSDGNILPNASGAMNVGYEVCAGGSHRVLRVCEDIHSSKQNQWQSHVSVPSARMDFKVPDLAITVVELTKQKNEVPHKQSIEDKIGFSPILCLRMSSMLLEFLNTEKHILFQLKVETLSVDEKWQGAPFAAMLRVHSQDRFKRGETVLQMAAVVSKHASNPNLVKYSSILLQAIDLNLDEETLMKLVPFYRYSLDESTSSRQMYFERFEIHPIKIMASFIPGQPLADYTSAQETFRALLHSFIKIPSIRGTTVELNGVLLSHALLTFRQLAIKCAQHYSWYAMRAIYVAKGSKLLPPAFASLFDDSAASSLDVFFDPSNGAIDLQGLTLGMFNVLRNGLNKRGYGGTSRYIGDLEHMMKTAGSNILFAVLTEVSDNVLKGAETGGFDGMVNGFRRGILNVAMEPSVLRVAVVKGGSSRRIKLDHSAGTDEMYIEGYLQAMLDALFKQDYLRVKVVDDQVLLKNLPPNSMLVDDIIGCVKNFLVGEGLLEGETSTAAIHSLRRLQGEHEKSLLPGLVALCEQLFVIFAVRGLRNQAKFWFYWGFKDRNFDNKTSANNQSDQQANTGANHQSEGEQPQHKRSINRVLGTFVLSSAMAYLDGRLCRHIPNTLARRIVSGFLLSFVE